MRGIVSIREAIEEIESQNYLAMVESSPFDFSFMVDVDLNRPFADYLDEKRREDIRTGMEIGAMVSCDSKDFEMARFVSFMEANMANSLELLKSCEYVSFDFDETSVREYIDKNPILQDKYIVINNPTISDVEEMERLECIYSGMTDRLRFDMKENTKLVTFEEYKKTVLFISETVDKIKTAEFSSLEAIMYAYDMARDHVYKLEGVDECAAASRDLSSVLIGESRVCKGFANILKSVLEGLGIRSTLYYLKKDENDKYGHMRVAAYVEDEKYGVRGVYYFDPTFDCKKEGNDDFLNSYKFFAKTKEEFERLQGRKIVDMTFGDFGCDYLGQFEDSWRESRLMNFPKRKLDNINRVAKLVDGKNLISEYKIMLGNSSLSKKLMDTSRSIDDVQARLGDYVEFMDRPLSANVLLKVFYNVRKFEYYENPDRYPFSLEAFYEVFKNSLWNVTGIEEQLLFALGQRVYFKQGYDRFLEFMEKEDLVRAIARVRLARTLRSGLVQEKKLSFKQKIRGC